ncbi:MAG TPA: hypothetical protein DCM27_07915 [Rhodospirillaceae bacterium]|nr:hypothetical protein [Rhodospirillaceae bacterium]
MSTESNAIIGNASDIIDRFGGIRPMSTKTGIPVTTIQGWKQRNAIPANRRNELIEAANRHGIHLSSLLVDIAGDKEEAVSEAEEKVIQKKKIQEAMRNPDMRPAGNSTTLLAAGSLIIVAAVAGVMLAMAPRVKEMTAQDVRIKELEMQLTAMKEAQKSVNETATPELGLKLSALEGRIGELSEQAKSYAGIAEDLKTGTVAQRLAKIESHMGSLLKQSNALGLQSVVQKIQLLQSSPEGEGQIQNLMSAFIGSVQGAPTDDVTQTFASLKDTNPQVADTFEDVAPEDMKAAVMLMGMAQLRDSLSRDNASFDQDLQILKMTMAKDNPELQAAIDRLASKAKSGVLTPNGLSKQLRGLTGDIVAASLSGQDVSIEDKAKARFGNIVKIEKNGHQLSGTETQITIAEAQKKLDAGDVEGAVALLRQIEGPAAEKTQPLISAAQSTLLASQVQQLIGNNLIQTLKGMGHKSVPYTAGGSGGLGQVLDQVKSIGSQIGAQVGGNP